MTTLHGLGCVAAACLLAVTLAGGCTRTQHGPVGGGPVAVGINGQMLTEDDIEGFTYIANRTAVDHARVALDRSSNSLVRAFAQRVLADHSAALQQQAAVLDRTGIEPNLTPSGRQLLALSKQQLVRELSLRGKDFDREYLDGQIRRDREVLRAIDLALLPQAMRFPVRAQIEQLRPMVAAHLEQALQVREQVFGGR